MTRALQQPDSGTLYAGYLLALAVALVVVALALVGERRAARGRDPHGTALAIAAVLLGLVLRFPRRRPGPRRRRTLRLAGLGLVLVVVAVLTGLSPAAAHADPAPTAGTVQVDTVPATPGVALRVDGRLAVTDARGRAEVGVADLDGVERRVALASRSAPGGGTVALTSTRRAVAGQLRTRRVVALLAVRRPVRLSFRDPKGRSVAAGEVRAVSLEGGGERLRLSPADLDRPVQLLTGTVVRAHGDWVVRPVTYALTAVDLNGANAVFAGTQKLVPRDTGTWSVELSVFALRLTVRDLFGRPVTVRAVLTAPDASTRSVAVAGTSPTTVAGLVRGQYDVALSPVVLGKKAAVLVSRDDAVQLRVVTRFDALVVLGALALAAGVVAVVGSRVAR